MPKKRRPLKARPASYEPIPVDTLEGMLRNAVKADMIDDDALKSIMERVRVYCWVPPFDPANPFKYANRV
jgi:hypothetical protein